MNDLYLIPKTGVTVRDPLNGKPLATAGETKPRTSYWLRRLRAGDVVEGKAPKTAATAPASTKGDAK